MLAGSLALFAALAFAACKKDPAPGGAATEVVPSGGSGGGKAGGAAAADPEAETEARYLFEGTCAICHGATGHGDGTAAANLNPKPRNYSDKAWQASVTDDDLRAIILKGGAAVGKSPMMPGQAQLADKPAVVDALVAIIRGFGR